jgi:HPt (histidine-containing phosphotransfer) domain-containing protein
MGAPMDGDTDAESRPGAGSASGLAVPHPGATLGPAPAAARAPDAAGSPPGKVRVLDRAALERLARALAPERAAALLRDLVAAFLADAPDRMAALRHAVEASDPERLRREAHALRGYTASLGATELADLCQTLETLGRLRSLAGAGGHLDRLEAAFGHVRRELLALVQGDTP